MAQTLTESFIQTSNPGAYFDLKVKSTPVGVASSGVIVIIGEADGGPTAADGQNIKDNFYGAGEADKIARTYLSGPIVDAARALSAPSSDTDITGTASLIYIAKTNQGTKASATLATAYGDLKDKNWGTLGNQYKYQVTNTVDESAPEITGTTIGAFGATLDGASFTIRQNGGAETVVTLGVGGHADIGTLVTELDGLLPAGLSAEAGAATDTLKIKADADASANQKGWGKSFELVDSTPGDLALLGHAEGLTASAAEPEVQTDITRESDGTNESLVASADIALEIGYEGTTGTITVTDTTMTTTVTGGAGGNLSVNLEEYSTISQLADYLNSQAGYTALASATDGQKSPTELDNVTGAGICSTAADLAPGRIKRAAAAYAASIAESAALDFTATAAEGLPDEMAAADFLAGGAKGATSGANIVSALAEAETIDANFVVPLFSRDASEDIADGDTDASSTYTIDAIHASTKNHVLAMSRAKVNKHRLGILSFWGSYSDAKKKAGTAANARLAMTMQRTTQTSSDGNSTVSFMPWHSAVIAAGMQAGGFYKGITNKQANVISYTDPSGFDSGSFSQREDAIKAGLMFLEQPLTGINWVVDQTTYSKDTNFVYNSLQVMYTVDLITLDLARSFKAAFVGKSTADVSASTGLSFLAAKAEEYKKQKLTSASADAPLGFKGAKVDLRAPVMSVKVEFKPSSQILFVPINVEVSRTENSASQ